MKTACKGCSTALLAAPCYGAIASVPSICSACLFHLDVDEDEPERRLAAVEYFPRDGEVEHEVPVSARCLGLLMGKNKQVSKVIDTQGQEGISDHADPNAPKSSPDGKKLAEDSLIIVGEDPKGFGFLSGRTDKLIV